MRRTPERAGKSLETQEVEALIRQEREGFDLVLREAFDLGTPEGRASFLRDVAAFANTRGGHMAIGVDHSRRPVGLGSGDENEAELNELAGSFYGLRLGLQYVTHVLSNGARIGWLWVPNHDPDFVVVPAGTVSRDLLAPGEVYGRRQGQSVRATSGELRAILSKVLAARGYVKTQPFYRYTRPVKEPVVRPPSGRLVQRALRSGQRTDFLDYRPRVDLNSPGDAAGLVRVMAAYANGRGGYLATEAGFWRSIGRELPALREFAEAYLGAPVELEYAEAKVPGSGSVGLLWVPAVDRIVAMEKSFVYEAASGEATTAFREGDVFYRDGVADVLAERRHYDLMFRKIVAAKDYSRQASLFGDGNLDAFETPGPG